ncbi:MAG: hypothetical protein DRJ08_01630 [Acidobacteria bacterium]|nr:MAG: hypothetical protein DRJ14_09180 [Acidobacteriota bacterium]RLE23999.1 MAG: hypothetical protein DRJ08_01630 [Acidobacteriota bacterium]
MKESMSKIEEHLHKLKSELENFEDIAMRIKPEAGDLPELNGIGIAGTSIPLIGKVGGDHLIYLDFKKRYDLDARIRQAIASGQRDVAKALERNRNRAGILVADVAGHRLTDAAQAAMLHQAFLLGVLYELDSFGTVTTRLFENLNTRFYQTSSFRKYITMIYGEISENGLFRFLSAAHPFPIVFSNRNNRIVHVGNDNTITFPPIGTMPSRDDVDYRQHNSPLGRKAGYTVNELTLMGHGDILLLFTDGFVDHENKAGQRFEDVRLEAVLREAKDEKPSKIVNILEKELLSFAKPDDDITFVVIKRCIPEKD